TINGAGFAPGEWVDLYWGSRQATSITEVTANEAGAWTTAVTVPESPAGPHRIFATGETSGLRLRGTVEVIPDLVREPVSGGPGTQVAVNVTGFAALESVDLHWGDASGQLLTTLTTDDWGSAAGSIT